MEAFLGGERLATHALFPAYARDRYSTNEGDIPKGHFYSYWGTGRILRWTERVGPSCVGVVERIFQSVAFEEQGFSAALAVLMLSHKYSAQRLERACEMALVTGKRSPRNRDIEPIRKASQDKLVDARGRRRRTGRGQLRAPR